MARHGPALQAGCSHHHDGVVRRRHGSPSYPCGTGALPVNGVALRLSFATIWRATPLIKSPGAPPVSKNAAVPPRRPLRADARRNVEKIVAAAGALVAEHGADASLEEVARRAGVGSATLHRHFPSRQALLEAVFKDRVEALCAKADDLLSDPDPGEALFAWLRAVGAHAVANRGLGASLMHGNDPTLGSTCHEMIINAGDALIARARAAGAVRPKIAIVHLLKLVSAISLATEQDPDGPAEADRMLAIAIDGVRAH
ncbi:TetR/AcrR family transcriptional regulator [Streptomyces sp. ISL-87]|nr:TetR/AcrR family transcriptional regulator [Streptomyces sp. ISL-21]MBT2613355.1 TetR/AcrR family transcriptional regulator [Streptomyces sp. ISL-87]